MENYHRAFAAQQRGSIRVERLNGVVGKYPGKVVHSRIDFPDHIVVMNTTVIEFRGRYFSQSLMATGWQLEEAYKMRHSIMETLRLRTPR